MQAFVAYINSFFDRYMSWFNFKLTSVKVIDIFEIVLIAIAIYYVLVWVKDTRAWSLMRGIIIVAMFIAVAAILQMTIIIWLVSKVASIAVIALVIIFQPELRTALERLGRRALFRGWFSMNNGTERYSQRTINEVARACQEMSLEKTGMIIIIERETGLDEYIRTGIMLDSEVSAQLLINIFEKNTPLHDGAVIVRGDRLMAATCYLPLSDNRNLSKDLGTRHRAAIGISELSDCISIIVSEETGLIAIAQDGVLRRPVNVSELRDCLEKGAVLPFMQRRSVREQRKANRQFRAASKQIRKEARTRTREQKEDERVDRELEEAARELNAEWKHEKEQRARERGGSR